jgi:hypothetical protein
MGIGLSLILIAAGAILTWAVETSVSGIDINAVGVILMIVGLIGLVLSLAFWSTWWGPGYFRRTAVAGPDRRRRRHVVVEDDPADEVVDDRY